MFVSQGTPKLEFDRTQLEPLVSRNRDRAAILHFCSIVNPKGAAYHPSFVQGEMPEESAFPNDFRPRMEFIRNMLGVAYKKAQVKHEENPSGNKPPNRIFYKQTSKSQYCLSWSTIGLEMQYVLTISKKTVSLRLIGRWENMVKRCALNCGLPAPTRRPRDSWFRMMQNPYIFEPRRQDSGLVALGDVKVPLGDLVDFLKKYR